MNFEEALSALHLTNIVDSARESLSKTLSTKPIDQDAREQGMSELAAALFERYNTFSSLDDLSEAIELYKELHNLTGANDSKSLPGLLNNLSMALLTRYEVQGDSKDLDRAVAHMNRALRLAVDGHPNWDTCLVSMSMLLLERFKRRGSLKDLNRAAAFAEEAVSMTPLYARNRHSRVTTLASIHLFRFQRISSVADVDRTIQLYLEAVRSMPDHYPGAVHIDLNAPITQWLNYRSTRLAYLNNLGHACRLRFEHTPSLADLTDSITYCEAAVDGIGENNPNRPAWMNNLANSYMALYRTSDRSGDVLSKIFRLRLDVVKATPKDHPYRASRLANLAATFHLNYERSKSPLDLDMAINHFDLALQITPAEHPTHALWLFHLGFLQFIRFKSAASPQDYRNSIQSMVQALRTESGPPSLRINAARYAALLIPASRKDVVETERDIKRRSQILRKAVQLLPSTSSRVLNIKEQEIKIAEFSSLARYAAAYSIQAGDHPFETLQILETGRGVVASLQLDTRTDITALEEAYTDYAIKFKELRYMLDPSVKTPAAMASWSENLPVNPRVSQRHTAAAEFDDLVREIRTLKGFERFLLGLSIEEMKALAEPGPIVIFNVSEMRSDAFILTTQAIKHLSLPNLDAATVKQNANSLIKAIDGYDSDSDTQVNQNLTRILEWLWDCAVEDILNELGFTETPTGDHWPHVWWIASGWLNVLPIHAAGYYGNRSSRNALDRVISSYTPTLQSLAYARERTEKRSSRPPKVLFISMPRTPEKADFPSVTKEVETVAAIISSSFKRTHLKSPDKDDIVARLQNFQIVHFACHGESDHIDPAKSVLLLKDWKTNPFTAADIIEMRLRHSKFVYLSACHTARIRLESSLDEGVHLAGACQLAGFSHVVGTLWAIYDSPSLKIASGVYDSIFVGPRFDFGNAASGLHFAIRKLRDMSSRTRMRPVLWASYIHMGA